MKLDAAFAAVRAALLEIVPASKCVTVAALTLPEGEWTAPQEILDESGIPGRPQKPALISPREVPNRGLGTAEGRAALVHAVAHIEFNAINLALDAAWRFRDMPAPYYRDWISVAQDEARHFLLLCQRLSELGYAYGDFPAHNGLWEAAEKTRDDVLARMALVPRVLEARGLDVTPGLIRRFGELKDEKTVAVLRVILEEEVRHVAIGSQWFHWLCQRRGVDSKNIFRELLKLHNMRVRPPFNREARSQAGFDVSELDELSQSRGGFLRN